jgi:hypothetical protein
MKHNSGTFLKEKVEKLFNSIMEKIKKLINKNGNDDKNEQ